MLASRLPHYSQTNTVAYDPNGKVIRVQRIGTPLTKGVTLTPDPASDFKAAVKADYVYADVQLFLQTDTMGNVTYLGIDLNRLGFEPLANLISVSNKVPALQISGQATGTVKSQLEFRFLKPVTATARRRPAKAAVAAKSMAATTLSHLSASVPILKTFLRGTLKSPTKIKQHALPS